MRENFTTEQKLEGVEHLIETLRPFRSQPGTAEHQTLALLKAIALDLRARLPGAPLRTAVSLEYRVNAAMKQRARFGYVEIEALRGIGEETLGKWSLIRNALERAER